jgi:hypothetical protein
MNCSYKNISNIIQSANLLTIEDPATYIRNHTKTSFKITEEECEILERMKNSQDMTEYKEYLLKHYTPSSLIHITCPNCDNKIKCSVSTCEDFICCSKMIDNNIHDHRCMYYNRCMYYKKN